MRRNLSIHFRKILLFSCLKDGMEELGKILMATMLL